METNPQLPSPLRKAAVVAFLGFTLLVPASLIGFGGWALYEQMTGTPATATILVCEERVSNGRRGVSTTSYECEGRWTVDGRAQTGIVDGVGPEALGQEVAVTVKDDRAYANANTAYFLLGGGIVLALGFGLWFWRVRKKVARAKAAATVAPGA